VTVLSDASIRELAAIRGEDGPITTCYLDVDGRRLVRQQDVEQELETLLRSARQRAADEPSVLEDLARIEKYVRAGIDRQGVRGMVFFASSTNDLWEVIPLPVRVRSQVVVNSSPAVAQLESILQGHEPIGVLLADRQRARLFVFELGRLVELILRERIDGEQAGEESARGAREDGEAWRVRAVVVQGQDVKKGVEVCEVRLAACGECVPREPQSGPLRRCERAECVVGEAVALEVEQGRERSLLGGVVEERAFQLRKLRIRSERFRERGGAEAVGLFPVELHGITFMRRRSVWRRPC